MIARVLFSVRDVCLMIFLFCAVLVQGSMLWAQENKGAYKRFKDWTWHCPGHNQKQKASNPVCEMFLIAEIEVAGERQRVFTLAFAPVKAKEANLVLTMLLPLNVNLLKPLRIEVDDKPLTSIPYRNCNQAGCWVQAEIVPAQIAQLRRGRMGATVFSMMNDKALRIKFSLSGFTGAERAMRANMQ